MAEQRSFAAFARRLRDTMSRVAAQPQTLDDSQFQAFALELFRLQYDSIAPYRSLCDRRNKRPGAVTDWHEIPALPTTSFKDLELTSLPLAERTHIFHSSGTTEQRPSRHFHSRESLALYESSLLPWFRQHLGETADLEFIPLTPPPSSCPHSSLIHMFETVQQAAEAVFFGELGNDGTWEIRYDAVLSTLESACVSKRPVILLGTAFLFVHLLDELERRHLAFQLAPRSRLIETGGYKGRSRELPKQELHRQLSKRLDLPAESIVCEYGMSELSSQAYDHVCGETSPRRFRFPPWARVLIVSPETGREVSVGETGLVRVHDLANVWSIAAVQTEDLAVRHGGGFELLGRAALSEPRGCSLMAR